MFPNRYFNNTQEVKKFFLKSKKFFFLDFLMENFSRIWKNWSILKTSTFEQLFSKACTSKNMSDMTKIRLETYQGTLKWHNLRFLGSDLDLYFSTSLHGALHGTPHLPCSRVKKKVGSSNCPNCMRWKHLPLYFFKLIHKVSKGARKK